MANPQRTLLSSTSARPSSTRSFSYSQSLPGSAVWFAFFNLAMVLLIFVLAHLATWRHLHIWDRPRAWPMMGLCVAGYLIALGVSLQWRRFHRDRGYLFTVVSTTAVFLVILGIITMTRTFYSRTFVVVFFGSTLFWGLAVQALQYRRIQTLALIPGEMTERLRSVETEARWIPLDTPDLSHPVDGVVADFHYELPDRWARFVSNCHVRGIPVFDATSVYEFYTGKVSLNHLSEDLVEGFSLPRVYSSLRRFIEFTVTLLASPFFLVLMGAVSLAIYLESGGPILFRQERVGRGGELFEMLKFRSMEPKADRDGPKFASESDHRVTRVGSFIRQYRLDELPQLWNVLKGEMSIIGPRPEQVPFAEKFEEEIPFYPYRHMVRPGITGWAQVNQGYVADTDRTYEKLAYDLYYLKYFSPWLDMLIVYRTLRIVLTGFGAR